MVNFTLRQRNHANRRWGRSKQPQRLVDVLSDAPLCPAEQPTTGHQAFLGLDLQQTVLAPFMQRKVTATAESAATNAEMQQIQRNLGIMSVGLGVALVGGAIAAPSLLLASAGCQLYCLTSYYTAAYKAIVRERRLTVDVLDSLLLSGALVGGFVTTAAIANWFVAVIRLLMTNTEDHSMHRLVELFGEQPKHVWILRDGLEIEIPFEQVTSENIVVVNAGQMIPIDGTLVDGGGLVDQHRLTGESQPVEKTIGDPLFAATVLLSGRLYIQVEQAGSATLAAQIGQTLNQTTDYRMNIQSDAIAFVDRLTTPTLILSGLALPVAGLSGALAVLWNVPGYRMMFFGPLNMLTHLHVALQNGLLIKDGRSLDLLRDVDTVVFDKTGTLTLDEPHLAQIHLFNGLSQDELLRYAAAAEQHQTHPIAKAILQAADDAMLTLDAVDNISYTLGNGLEAAVAGKTVHVGSRRFLETASIALCAEAIDAETRAYEQGFSVVMVAIDGQLAGLLELHATIRPEAQQTIDALQAAGKDLYIISGDYEAPTRFLANELGIPNYFAQVLPEDKAALVAELQEEGRSVCFVGDGINDSIALKQANVSVSIAGATTIATDTAHIILMRGDLSQLADIFGIVEQYASDLRTYYKATIIPGALCTLATFLFGWGFLTAVMVAQGSTFLALGKVVKAMKQHE